MLALVGALTVGAVGCSADTAGSREVVPIRVDDEARTPGHYTDSFHEQMVVYTVMGVDEFEALPRDERLSYGRFLMDQTAERGNYEVDYGHESSEYRIDPVEASPGNTPQEILDIHQYAMQMTFLQFIEADASKPYDSIDGRKMLSSVYYNVGDGIVSNQYLALRDWIPTSNEAGPIHYSLTAVETGPLSHGVDVNSGDDVQYVDIRYFDSREPEVMATGRFVYCEFVDYAGEAESTWLLEMITLDDGVFRGASTIE